MLLDGHQNPVAAGAHTQRPFIREMTVEWVALWLGLSVVVGMAASARGRTGLGWFLLSLVISPLLALLVVLVLGRAAAPAEREDQRQRAIAERLGNSDTYRKCPSCAEIVKREAVKCRFCGATLSALPAQNSGMAYAVGKAVGTTLLRH